MNENAKKSYLDWFNSSFTNEEVLLLSEIGIECGADHNFFKYEILDIFGFITNRKLKIHLDLYEKFITRYKQLIPSFLHSQIDEKLLREDQYYAAWFFNRHCFLKEQEKAKESVLNSDGFNFKREYVLWCPIDDMHCPKECLFHSNTVYHVLDDEFIEYSVDHWTVINHGCRCTLISLSERNVRNRVSKGQCYLSRNLVSRFSQELLEAKRNQKTFNQVAYNLVFEIFPYFHLYNPENYFSDDDTDGLKDYCLRELQIIVESLDIVQNTHYVDTAQSRLDLARSKLEQVLQQKSIFDKTTYEAISAKLCLKFRNAHTCVYQNIYSKHIEKSKTVKRQATKEKYLSLARQAIDEGLKDEFADHTILNDLLTTLSLEHKAP